jgi:hypothetical protein
LTIKKPQNTNIEIPKARRAGLLYKPRIPKTNNAYEIIPVPSAKANINLSYKKYF